MSQPVSPTIASTTLDPNAAILELERKMKELEAAYLGSSVAHSGSVVGSKSPFAPISSVEKRLERLKSAMSLSAVQKDVVQSKLPAVPVPTFDGSDLENFLKDWERWLRLSGVQFCSEQVQLDWLVQACTPKVKKLVEKVIEEKKVSLTCCNIWQICSQNWKMTYL